MVNGIDNLPVIGDEHAAFVQGSVSIVAASCIARDGRTDPSAAIASRFAAGRAGAIA